MLAAAVRTISVALAFPGRRLATGLGRVLGLLLLLPGLSRRFPTPTIIFCTGLLGLGLTLLGVSLTTATLGLGHLLTLSLLASAALGLLATTSGVGGPLSHLLATNVLAPLLGMGLTGLDRLLTQTVLLAPQGVLAAPLRLLLSDLLTAAVTLDPAPIVLPAGLGSLTLGFGDLNAAGVIATPAIVAPIAAILSLFQVRRPPATITVVLAEPLGTPQFGVLQARDGGFPAMSLALEPPLVAGLVAGPVAAPLVPLLRGVEPVGLAAHEDRLAGQPPLLGHPLAMGAP